MNRADWNTSTGIPCHLDAHGDQLIKCFDLWLGLNLLSSGPNCL